MANNIVELVKSYASSDIISRAGSFLGESESSISKAASGLIPILLGGLASKVTTSEAGAEEVYQAARTANEGGWLTKPGALFGNADIISKGTALFNGIFGSNSNQVIDAVSNFAGIKSSSSNSLISLLLPLITAVLGKHSVDNNLGASGLARFLNDQKSNIQSALPIGLSFASALFGFSPDSYRAGSAARETVNTEGEATTYSDTNVADHDLHRTENNSGGLKWLLPLLLLAVLGLGVWYFLGKNDNAAAENNATADTTATADTAVTALASPTNSGHYDSTSGNFVYDVGADKEISLADGTKLTVGTNSTEAKLYEFLTNGIVDTADKTRGWITLDRVYFETGKSDLTANSQDQLKNIATILKNFTSAKVKLGGYTDNTGASDANIKLSGDRAGAAAAELVKLGVTKANVESEGYGPEHPVCEANDTPECKAQNRRIDIRVTAK